MLVTRFCISSALLTKCSSCTATQALLPSADIPSEWPSLFWSFGPSWANSSLSHPFRPVQHPASPRLCHQNSSRLRVPERFASDSFRIVKTLSQSVLNIDTRLKIAPLSSGFQTQCCSWGAAGTRTSGCGRASSSGLLFCGRSGALRLVSSSMKWNTLTFTLLI